MSERMLVIGDSIAGFHAQGITVSAITLNGTTTMTVTAPSHAMYTGQPIYGFGCTDEDLNGRFTITRIDNNTFTVTLPVSKSGTAVARNATFQCYNTHLLLDKGSINWLSVLNGACFDIVGVCAEAGSTASYLPTLLAKASGLQYDWVAIISGINDAAADNTGGTIASRIIPIVDGLLSAGKRVIISTIGPWSSNNPGYSVARNQQAMNANFRLKEYASKHRNVFIMDTIAAGTTLTSTTGAVISNVLVDGAHPTQKGAYLYAKRFKVDYPTGLPSPTNLLPVSAMQDENVSSISRQAWNNPLLAGTGGSRQGDTIASGSLADSQVLYITGVGQTVVCSKTTNSDAIGAVQQVDWTSVSNGNSCGFYPADLTADISDGEYVRPVMRVTVGGAPTQLNSLSIYHTVNWGAGISHVTGMLYSSSPPVAANFPQLDGEILTFVCPKRLISSLPDITSNYPSFRASVNGADDITFYFERVANWAI